MLGRLPASDFAPHVFDEGQKLPFSLPPEQPEKGCPAEDRSEKDREPVPVVAEEPAPAPQAPKQIPATLAPKPHALQPVEDPFS